MKVFVAVGFENYPFDRLVGAVESVFADAPCAAEVFLQTGVSGRRPRAFGWRDFLTFDEIVSRVREADLVISHAGVGTTMLALSFGKSPILFPRQALYGEHVDDHQADFAARMERLGKVRVAWDEAGLREAVRACAAPDPGEQPRRGEEGSAALSRFLEELLESRRKRRSRP